MSRTTAEIVGEIHRKFGFLPPFFEVGSGTPEILDNLWQQTKVAYLENPINPVFLEKLFAYLSRFCNVPYCVVCHSCFLRPLGLHATEVLELLEQPAPAREEIDDLVARTNELPAGLENWPSGNPEVEHDILRLSVAAYLGNQGSSVALLMLRRLLSQAWYDQLIIFLAYVRTCGIWIDSHPELSHEADQRFRDHYAPSVKEAPGLIEFFATYRERVSQELRRRQT